VLVVSVEFCMVFWAADFLRAEGGLGSGAATAAAAGFIGGMAVGRVAVGPITRLQPVPLRLLTGAASLATTGFVLLWVGGSPVPAVAGLVVTGLGVALLYPVTLAEALAAWPADPDRAAARCVLASGLAVGAAPLALGALADAVTLRTAVLLTPLLLLAFLWRCAARLAVARRPGR
jgi:fucose permease